MNTLLNKLLSAADVARTSGVSTAAVYNAVHEGRLPVSPLAPAGRKLFEQAAVDAWMNRPRRRGVRRQIEMTCTFCGEPLPPRWPSKAASKDGNAFCRRACFHAWRHGKAAWKEG